MQQLHEMLKHLSTMLNMAMSMDRRQFEDLSALVIALVSAAAAWAEQRPDYAGVGAILSILAKVLPSLLPGRKPQEPQQAQEKQIAKPVKPEMLRILNVSVSGFVRYFPAGSCRRYYPDAPLEKVDYDSYYFSRGSMITVTVALAGGKPPYTIRTNLGSIAETTELTIVSKAFPVDWDMLDGITVWVFDSSSPQQHDTYRYRAAIYGTGDIDPYAGCKPGRTGWCIDCLTREDE